MISRYFAEEKKEIERLNYESEKLSQQMEELIEETGGQESPLEALRGSKGITKSALQDRVLKIKTDILASRSATSAQKELAKTIKKDFAKQAWQKGITDEAELFTELDILFDYLMIFESELRFKAEIKDREKTLFEKVQKKYAQLSIDQLKTLIIEDKWLSRLLGDIQSEQERVSQVLTNRIRQLAERYAKPLPAIKQELEMLAVKVDGHLIKMGFHWQAVT